MTIALTTYNRTDLLFESIRNVIDDDRVTEVVIVDDHSPIDVAVKIQSYYSGYSKVRFFRNEVNLGCYRNKREAISLCLGEWVCLWDSDNIFDAGYLDALTRCRLDRRTLYQPEFARPHFDFRAWAGLKITNHNVQQFAYHDTFTTMLNAMNYFVHRDEYMRVWEAREEPWTADSILQNYNWLNAGNAIYVVPGLQYDHRVHEGSHYKEHRQKTGGLFEEVVQKLKTMRSPEPFNGALTPYDYQMDN